MKEIVPLPCQVHVNVCTNERTDGRVACHDVGGHELFRRLKDQVKDAGLRGTHWVTRTGCLGYCNAVGTTVAIHRRGESARFYTEVQASDFDAIWQEIIRK